jgi:hypothetical protein
LPRPAIPLLPARLHKKAPAMRMPALFFLAAAAAPAVAQPVSNIPTATFEALRRDFPVEHAALAGRIAGKAPEEARGAAYAGIRKFLHEHLDAIASAPGPTLVALEGRQGALLRSLGRQDMALCAIVGDRGLFGQEALAGPAPAGLDDFGAALVAAAKAGAGGGAPGAAAATVEDIQAWFLMLRKIEPDIPIREMLTDKALRAAAPPEHLCHGAAAMHEAGAALPGVQGERMSRMLLRLSLAVPEPQTVRVNRPSH